MEKGNKFNIGRWTKEEHLKFLKGIIEYGNNWKMVEKLIKTRSSSQARSHAQKYFEKVKKKIINQKKIFNARNLLNYVFNSIKNFKGGQPLSDIQKKRTLNLLISNFQFRKDEIESCNMILKETRNINSQKDEEKYNFYKDCDIASEKNNIMNEIKNNSDSKSDAQENKMEFCNKKRKNSGITNKIFKINKVAKYKYSNKVNSKKNIFVNSKKPNIKKFIKIKNSKKKKATKNQFNQNNIYPIFTGDFFINNITNIRNNCQNNDLNCSINSNMKSINMNDLTSINKNKFNFTESLFDFGLNIKNNFVEDEHEHPKNNILDSQKKLFFDGIEFKDSFKNNFYEESLLSLGEKCDENSIINKIYDLFE